MVQSAFSSFDLIVGGEDDSGSEWFVKVGRVRITGLRRRPRLSHFGKGSRIEEPVLVLSNPAGIWIGDNVTIGSYAVLEANAPHGRRVLSIGNDTYIGYFARVTAATEVRIGAHVLISDRVYVSDTGHNYEDTTTWISHQGLRSGRHVEICDGAWIGIGAVIVGNVRVGIGAVVGANSLVQTDVPDYSVVVGNPARVVRHYDGENWRSRDRD